jgi:hypothetical protein
MQGDWAFLRIGQVLLGLDYVGDSCKKEVNYKLRTKCGSGILSEIVTELEKAN